MIKVNSTRSTCCDNQERLCLSFSVNLSNTKFDACLQCIFYNKKWNKLHKKTKPNFKNNTADVLNFFFSKK